MKATFVLILSMICQALYLQAQPAKTLLIDASKIANFKLSLKTNKDNQDVVKQLTIAADKLLNMKPVSVMTKALTPASGNKHDYMSQAPYFWYDSSKKNGLPYMRKDGERNPETLRITDRKNIGDLQKATNTLSLAYYLTNDEKYAAKTAELLRHWFLNEATKMNPNLDYAQAVPGVNTGRGIGIIETIALTGIADAAILIEPSTSWKSIDEKALKQWYSNYLDWMLTSKNGLDEMATKNNHATFYDMQVVDFALFTGNKKVAVERLKNSKERMDIQIDEEGKMPLELERTTALGYSTFNLEAWFNLATLAELAGVDLWHFKNKKGTGIKNALDWLAPYAAGQKEWTYEQINPYKKDVIYSLFLEAAEKYKDESYLQLAKQLNYKPTYPVEIVLLNSYKK